MTKYVRTSEDFDARLAAKDPRFENTYPDIFRPDDWAVALFLLKDRFETLGQAQEITVRGTVTRLLEARPLVTERVHKGRVVNFHTVDRILEATYKKIFGAISAGANTLPPEDRKVRKAPAAAKSNVDWQGPLGDLLLSMMTLMGPHYSIKDYVEQFVFWVRSLPGYAEVPFNLKALQVRVTRVRRELQVSKDSGKAMTREQILADLAERHPDEDEEPSLYVDSSWTERAAP